MSKFENICTVGDRVEITSQKGTQGIVVDLDLKGYEGIPRAKVYWNKDSTINEIYLQSLSWICETNLTMLATGEDLQDRILNN